MTRKIFISHSTEDKKYVDMFVSLLKKFGFQEQNIFYSSDISQGVEPGELIMDRLKEELTHNPIVVYFLSQNYYTSVVCLNEMGASWLASQDHYPIALPGFLSQDIKGAINRDRLTIFLNEKTSVKEIHSLLKNISKKAGVEADEDVAIDIKGNITPFQKELQMLVEEEKYLCPDEEGLFDVVLEKERILPENWQEKSYCFKLPGLINPKKLGVGSLEKGETHWLFLYKTLGEFKVGDRVQFYLNEQLPFENKKFNDIGNCKNIYVSQIKKVG